jgi:hypothetical protein
MTPLGQLLVKGFGWVKTLVKPLEPLLTHQCHPELLPRSPNFP